MGYPQGWGHHKGEICKNTKRKPHVGKGKKCSFHNTWTLCNQRENPSIFLFDKEHIFLCFPAGLCSVPFSTRTLLFHEHEGNMPPHLTAPLCFQPGSSIPLGAVRVGCSGCFRHSSPLPQLMCPWLQAQLLCPGAALLALPPAASSSQGCRHTAPAKPQILGLTWLKGFLGCHRHCCPAPSPALKCALNGISYWASSHSSHVPCSPLWAMSSSRLTLLPQAI